MNTRILTSVLTIVAVVAAVSAATYAFFSDSGTSTNNVFSTGTLDLQLSNDNKTFTDDVTATWGATGMVPGGGTSGDTLYIKNNGSIAGFLDLSGVDVDNFENSCLAPETVAGDVTCGVGADQGELGANLLIHVFWDNDDNGTFNAGDVDVYGTSGTPLSLNGFEAGLYNLNAPIVAGATRFLRINWTLPGTTGNNVQSDSAVLSLTVELDQTAD